MLKHNVMQKPPNIKSTNVIGIWIVNNGANNIISAIDRDQEIESENDGREFD